MGWAAEHCLQPPELPGPARAPSASRQDEKRPVPYLFTVAGNGQITDGRVAGEAGKAQAIPSINRGRQSTPSSLLLFVWGKADQGRAGQLRTIDPGMGVGGLQVPSEVNFRFCLQVPLGSLYSVSGPCETVL